MPIDTNPLPAIGRLAYSNNSDGNLCASSSSPPVQLAKSSPASLAVLRDIRRPAKRKAESEGDVEQEPTSKLIARTNHSSKRGSSHMSEVHECEPRAKQARAIHSPFAGSDSPVEFQTLASAVCAETLSRALSLQARSESTPRSSFDGPYSAALDLFEKMNIRP